MLWNSQTILGFCFCRVAAWFNKLVSFKTGHLCLWLLMLFTTALRAELDEVLLTRLQEASVVIHRVDQDFYTKACAFADASPGKYDFVDTLLARFEEGRISPFQVSNLLNIAKCSLECAYIQMNGYTLPQQ